MNKTFFEALVETIMHYYTHLPIEEQRTRIESVLSDVYDLGHADGYAERVLEEMSQD